MKTFFNPEKYLVACLFICVCLACSKQIEQEAMVLSEVENIVEQQPDSALSLLNSILFPENLKESQYNQFILLQIQAKDKCDKDITSDTIIFNVKDYYLKKKDYQRATLAAFYCGRVFREQNEVEKAATAYYEAEKYAEFIDDNNLKGLIQGNLSLLYFDQVIDDKAIVCGKQAVVLYDQAGNYKNEINVLLLIGNCFLFENEMDSAFYYYDRGLKLADSCKIIIEQVKTRQNISVAYREVGEFKKAKDLLQEALSFSIDDNTEKARILMNLAKTFIIENQLDSAKFYIDKSISLQAQDPALSMSTYLLLSEMNKSESRYKEALAYFKEYNDLLLKTIEENKYKELLELQGKYELEKLKNKNSKLVIDQQRTMLGFSVAFLCAVFIAFFFYRRSILDKKKLSESEQKIESLKKMAQSYSEGDDNSIRNILLHHFSIMKKVALIEKEVNEKDRMRGDYMIKRFNKIVYEQDTLDWDKFYKTINKLQNGLYDRVREKYPQLEEVEFRLCYLSSDKNELDDSEISVIMGMTISMIRKIRSEIRKKLGIPPYYSIHTFFVENLKKKD
jgi:tetratricopeptide (TPR) repeat protein